MQIRDRVRELRRVPAGSLRPHPKNWRTHPTQQRDALRGVLAEIGFAGALLARELEDGSLELIDGHLRAETAPDALIPVLVVDLTASEADMLLAVHDPLAAMAGRDEQHLAELLAGVETANDALQSLLNALQEPPVSMQDAEPEPLPAEVDVPECYELLVTCQGEREQRALYERLIQEGYPCRVMTL